jgi:coenzyme F420-0:L-glutamate ligase/coenzyme F420-1:gamma-L-glutamate ligase
MTIAIIPVPGLPMIQPGDDLGALLGDAIESTRVGVKEGDVVAVCQKVVSKAEGAIVSLASVEPSAFARELAAQGGGDRDPRVIEVVLRQTRRVVRNDRGHLIVETAAGWVCANAGVDQSNGIDGSTVTLLPEDADASAARLRQRLEGRFGVRLAVVITDTFGRPWRDGLVDVALGCAGLEPLSDLHGRTDLHGRPLQHTVMAVADQLAAAAGLAMEKDAAIAAVVIRGAPYRPGDGGAARHLVRPPELDLFR